MELLNKFEQSENGSTRVPQVRYGEVEMVVSIHVDGILAHAQATMERFAAELGQKFKAKSMAEKFGVEKAKMTPASSGVPSLSTSG